MTNTNEITTIETVEEQNVGTGKHKVTAAQKRQLQVLISDIANNIPADADDATIQRMRNRLGDLVLMQGGHIPFDRGIEIKATPITEKSDAKLFTAYFFIDVADMRQAKICLMRSLMLSHMPHCMSIGGDKNNTARRLSVREVSKEAANRVFAANPQLFTALTFNDEDRTSSGIKEPVTQPVSKAQPEVVEEPIIVEAELPEEVAENVSKDDTQDEILVDTDLPIDEEE